MGKKNISSFEKCANCGACCQICPTKAIVIDSTGLFYLPIVNENLCVGCGKCVAVCPVNTLQSTQHLRSAYGGAHRDDDVVKHSSSGGVFHALAQCVIANGGVVFGAKLSDDCRSVIFSNTDECDLEALQKSKYVESQIGNSFVKAKQALSAGREVLFCGAPCQIAGLQRFLGRDYENLYTCDFSCGGLPSHQIFSAYIADLEQRYGAPTVNVDFRPKTFGWKTHAICVTFSNGKRYSKVAVLDPFFRAFLYERVSMRDYCYSCDFSDNHASDLILADFWLHEKLSRLDNNDKGLSLILVNSEKGESLLRKLDDVFYLESLELEKASYNIKDGDAPKEVIDSHYRFVEEMHRFGFGKAARLLKPPLRTIVKQKIKEMLFAIRRKT